MSASYETKPTRPSSGDRAADGPDSGEAKRGQDAPGSVQRVVVFDNFVTVSPGRRGGLEEGALVEWTGPDGLKVVGKVVEVYAFRAKVKFGVRKMSGALKHQLSSGGATGRVLAAGAAKVTDDAALQSYLASRARAPEAREEEKKEEAPKGAEEEAAPAHEAAASDAGAADAATFEVGTAAFVKGSGDGRGGARRVLVKAYVKIGGQDQVLMAAIRPSSNPRVLAGRAVSALRSDLKEHGVDTAAARKALRDEVTAAAWSHAGGH